MPGPPVQPVRLAWRVAGRIGDQLRLRQRHRLVHATHDRNDLSTYLERWQRLSRMIDIASRRRWLGALSLGLRPGGLKQATHITLVGSFFNRNAVTLAGSDSL